MSKRKIAFYKEGFFHITSKSIEDQIIFKEPNDFLRFKQIIKYYNHSYVPIGYCRFLEQKIKNFKITFENEIFSSPPIVSIFSFCIMDTHVHLILKQKTENGITDFCRKIFQSYSCHFNKKYNRKGPLWTGRFHSTHIKSEDQLIHDIAYVHLNPVTAYMVENPQQWKHSSHHQYLAKNNKGICELIKIPDYENFILERIEHFRERSEMKKLESVRD